MKKILAMLLALTIVASTMTVCANAAGPSDDEEPELTLSEETEEKAEKAEKFNEKSDHYAEKANDDGESHKGRKSKTSDVENPAKAEDNPSSENGITPKVQEEIYDVTVPGLEPAVKEKVSDGYGLWVNGIEVTEANRGNILGGWSFFSYARYTPAQGDKAAVLTLCNVTLDTMYDFDGDITDNDSAVIYSKNDIIIKLIGRNYINVPYVYSDSDNGAEHAGILCESDLTFVGDGSINIQFSGVDKKISQDSEIYYAGIYSLGDLTINSGYFNIVSVFDGIGSNNDITINGGRFDIEAQCDGIWADKSITINDGEFYIDAEDDGIESDGEYYIKWIRIDPDTVEPDSYSGSMQTVVKNMLDAYHKNMYWHDLSIPGNLDNGAIVINGGSIDIISGDEGIYTANGDLVITGGVINIDCDDEGIAATYNEYGDVYIAGGQIDIEAYADGICADEEIYIFDGEISIAAAEDCEQSNGIFCDDDDIEIYGGTIDVVCECDAIWAASDDCKAGICIYNCKLSVIAGRDGIHVDDHDETHSEDEGVYICGADIYIEAGKDGIASGGDGDMYFMADCNVTIYADSFALCAEKDVLFYDGVFNLHGNRGALDAWNEYVYYGGVFLNIMPGTCRVVAPNATINGVDNTVFWLVDDADYTIEAKDSRNFDSWTDYDGCIADDYSAKTTICVNDDEYIQYNYKNSPCDGLRTDYEPENGTHWIYANGKTSDELMFKRADDGYGWYIFGDNGYLQADGTFGDEETVWYYDGRCIYTKTTAQVGFGRFVRNAVRNVYLTFTRNGKLAATQSYARATILSEKHEYTYVDLQNGTHIAICTHCGIIGAEDGCKYENGICSYCGCGECRQDAKVYVETTSHTNRFGETTVKVSAYAYGAEIVDIRTDYKVTHTEENDETNTHNSWVFTGSSEYKTYDEDVDFMILVVDSLGGHHWFHYDSGKVEQSSWY